MDRLRGLKDVLINKKIMAIFLIERVLGLLARKQVKYVVKIYLSMDELAILLKPM